MGEIDGAVALRALGRTYRAITGIVTALPDAAFDRATGCEGWSVRDLLFHLLLDPQRALVALASPANEEPTVDLVSYWRGYQPGSAEAARHAEFVRRAASAYSHQVLVEQWAETSEAAVRAAAWALPATVRVHTQGLIIAIPDLLATLAVEAALHHLDLTAHLDTAPSVPATALDIVRLTLDGLLGAALPVDWDGETYALKATGRMALSDGDREGLGLLVGRLPLLG
ncbi:MAG: maleylpyruvate isomerase N-terminal domain-containing protein [Candidatus Dormibacteria bacterium]|jgi:hypothetical protein